MKTIALIKDYFKVFEVDYHILENGCSEQDWDTKPILVLLKLGGKLDSTAVGVVPIRTPKFGSIRDMRFWGMCAYLTFDVLLLIYRRCWVITGSARLCDSRITVSGSLTASCMFKEFELYVNESRLSFQELELYVNGFMHV